MKKIKILHYLINLYNKDKYIYTYVIYLIKVSHNFSSFGVNLMILINL